MQETKDFLLNPIVTIVLGALASLLMNYFYDRGLSVSHQRNTRRRKLERAVGDVEYTIIKFRNGRLHLDFMMNLAFIGSFGTLSVILSVLLVFMLGAKDEVIPVSIMTVEFVGVGYPKYMIYSAAFITGITLFRLAANLAMMSRYHGIITSSAEATIYIERRMSKCQDLNNEEKEILREKITAIAVEIDRMRSSKSIGPVVRLTEQT